MIQKSIKVNFIFNIFRILSTMTFPLITYPYISRILQPEGIGKVAFANSVIAFFIMLASFGIPLYGVRECAKARDDKKKLSLLVQELMSINLFFTILAYIILFILIFSIPSFEKEMKLFFIVSTGILFNTLGVEWLYQGLEEYVYITIRSFIFQVISMILLFVFVKTQEDYLVYAGLTVFSSFGSNILNLFYARNFISWKKEGPINIMRHLKPILTLFVMALSVSIYVNLDTVMLGLLTGEKSVGLYTTAIKISKIVLTLVTSLGTVLIPRFSYYIEKGNQQELSALLTKSVNILMLMAIPMTLGLILLSKEAILIVSGIEYLDAVVTMKIVSPIILIIGLSNLIGIQVLMPLGKEKLTLYSILIGASVNFILNLILIPKFKQNGAAIATLIAESCVTIAQLFFAWGIVSRIIFTKEKLKILYAGLIMIFVVLAIKMLISTIILRSITSVVIGSITYIIYLYKSNYALVKELVDSYFLNKIKIIFNNR